MIHIHARTPDGTPSYEIEDFRAITSAILDAVDDVIVNYSTGAIGVPLEKRIEYLRALKPEVGALNMGSMNYAKYSRRRKDFVFADGVREQLRDDHHVDEGDERARDQARARVLRLRPRGQPRPAARHGLLKPPLQVSCVMGVTGGIRPSAKNLAHMSEQIPDVPHEWGVIGISRQQWELVAAALTLGGNVRVGLEDNFYLPDGETARSNGDLIAKARQMTEDIGRKPATVAQARELLGLPDPAPPAEVFAGAAA